MKTRLFSTSEKLFSKRSYVSFGGNIVHRIFVLIFFNRRAMDLQAKEDKIYPIFFAGKNLLSYINYGITRSL